MNQPSTVLYVTHFIMEDMGYVNILNKHAKISHASSNSMGSIQVIRRYPEGGLQIRVFQEVREIFHIHIY